MRADTDADILYLREGLRDLVALSALPAVWIGREPPAVAAGLADALVGLLQLDFAFVRLSDPGGAGAVEVTRGTAWTGFPEWLEGRLATSAPFPRNGIVPDIGDDSAPRCGLAVLVGFNGDGGVVAAASRRSDFPTPMDQLLLSLAANHAAGAFQGARLVHERKRAEEALRNASDELEVQVAERTAELHAANDELNALRRVATLVAEGVRPQDLFAVVAEEVGRIVDVPLISVVRYEPDRTATECASFSTEGPPFQVGKRWSLEGTNVLRLVRESAEPARIDDHSQLEGEIADAFRSSGVRSTVGVPVVVAGHVWGALGVFTTGHDPPPLGTEARLAEFTELVATAVENAEARGEVERLAEEQTALRRVATLVAEGASPTAVFDAVAAEMAGLLGAGHAAVFRYESGAELTVLAHRGSSAQEVPPGARMNHEGDSVEALVRRTERSARMDSYEGAGGVIAELARAAGVRVAFGAPIVVDGRLWGVVSAGWSWGDLPPADAEDRMAKFAQLLATAIANADSRDQLTGSRARLLTAGDEARRRVVRDLHDGAQQRLVHTIVMLKLARRALQQNDGDAESLVGEPLEQAQLGNVELRELAPGILPSVLTHGGLPAAVDSIVARLDIPVEVDVAAERLPAEIEASAYFVVAEALTNVVKHAHAGRAEVRASVEDGLLVLEVRDDGAGGADPNGHGLVGMSDRAAALGGRLKIESPPGRGTLLAATLSLSV